MTSIIVKGSIFRPFRNWLADKAEGIARRREEQGLPPAFSVFGFVNNLISCVQCAGFWCGLFCGLFLITADGYVLWHLIARTPQYSDSAMLVVFNKVMMLFCCGVAGSFSAMLGDVLFETLYFTKEYTARRLHEEEHHLHAEHQHLAETEEQDAHLGA